MSRRHLAPDEFVRLSKDYAEILPVAEAAREVRRLRAEVEVARRDGRRGRAPSIRELAAEEMHEIQAACPRPSARWR